MTILNWRKQLNRNTSMSHPDIPRRSLRGVRAWERPLTLFLFYHSRYPYIAMEILCADIVDVQEAIFRNSQFLDKILSFWSTPEPLDHFRAGYVNRVTSALLNKRRSEVISRFRAQENFVSSCLSHLDDTHVVDLLLKLIASDDAESSAMTVGRLFLNM